MARGGNDLVVFEGKLYIPILGCHYLKILYSAAENKVS
jgi:hypothetical protein